MDRHEDNAVRTDFVHRASRSPVPRTQWPTYAANTPPRSTGRSPNGHAPAPDTQDDFGWRVLTLAVAAVPATVLSFGALIVLFIGIGMLFDDSVAEGFVTVLWGLGGLYGMVAAWLVVIRAYGRFTVAGLISGLLAVLPLTLSILQYVTAWRMSSLEDVGVLLIGLSLVVLPVAALCWLVAFARGHR
jgi:hypothetical protein